MLWHVDANGLATKWMTLLGLPRELSQMTARGSGIALAFAPAGEPAVGVDGDGLSMKDAHFLKVEFPAVLAITAGDVIPTVVKEDIHAPQDLDVAGLKLQRLVPTSTPHQWLGYDAASGILMRVRLTPKS
jgi:hypothetical protein